jgi:hypothetical protein
MQLLLSPSTIKAMVQRVNKLLTDHGVVFKLAYLGQKVTGSNFWNVRI